MCQLPGQEKWKLFGIESWSRGCGLQGFPPAFTRVYNYIQWIQNILNQEDETGC